MTEALPLVYLGRHGETAWSLSGQHTGRTDLPLTENGERQAYALGAASARPPFAKVLTSPSQRAVRTCELAGFGARRRDRSRSWPSGITVSTRVAAPPTS